MESLLLLLLLVYVADLGGHMAAVSVMGSSKSDEDSFCSSILFALDHGPAVRAAIRAILSRCDAVLGANVS